MNYDLIEIQIYDYRIFGGGNSFHTEYLLLFIPSNTASANSRDPGKNWTVLRRYAEVFI
jgi:hypothetical protein